MLFQNEWPYGPPYTWSSDLIYRTLFTGFAEVKVRKKTYGNIGRTNRTPRPIVTREITSDRE